MLAFLHMAASTVILTKTSFQVCPLTVASSLLICLVYLFCWFSLNLALQRSVNFRSVFISSYACCSIFVRKVSLGWMSMPLSWFFFL